MKAAALVTSVGCATLVLGAGWLARRDYRAWHDLGEGGVPWGLSGWLTVTRLRLRQRDPFDVSPFPSGAEHPELVDLDPRGERPKVAPHPIPHRQLNGETPPGMLADLQALFAEELARRTPQIEERESGYERHHPALYARAMVRDGRSATGEIGHFHRPQGSLHLHLNPADARVVIERGWGELHGLVGQRTLPTTYTLLYAPRNARDLDGVRRILRATLDWAAAEQRTAMPANLEGKKQR